MIHIYCRVSTTEQASSDKCSLSDQEKVCRAISSLHGEDNPLVFRDGGVSGSVPLTDRPAGRDMLEIAKTGDILIASKMDRMFRSARDALVTVDLLKTRGIKVILCNISSDPVSDNGAGGLFFKIMAAVADFEKDQILERTAQGKRGKKDRGGHIGGDAPYGFSKVGSGREAILIECTGEKQVVGAMVRMHRSGMAANAIANNLNASNVPAREGRWSAKQVILVLERNP